MAEAVLGSVFSSVIGGIFGSGGSGSAGSAGSAAAAAYFADQKYKIAKEASDRAQELHVLALAKAKDDLLVWQEHARNCLIKTVDHDCDQQFEKPQYAEMEARAQAAVQLAIGKAKKKLRECASTYCVGATCAQTAQLEVQAGIALADVVTFARAKEDARVNLKNQAIRQNRMNSVAIVRGNYNAAQSGLDALARIYSQQAALAGMAASNSAGTAANLFARAFGQRPDVNRSATQAPAPIVQSQPSQPGEPYYGDLPLADGNGAWSSGSDLPAGTQDGWVSGSDLASGFDYGQFDTQAPPIFDGVDLGAYF